MRKGHNGEEKQGEKKAKTDENSGHYVIASSRPFERRPLKRRTLVPKSKNSTILKTREYKSLEKSRSRDIGYLSLAIYDNTTSCSL